MPLQLPIGAEDSFQGVVDLVRMQAIYWNETDMGTTYEAKDIPEELMSECQKWHEHMLEAAAEACEELMDKYLEDGKLSEDEIHQGIRLRTLAGEIVPAFCGSAFKNKGVQAMLDAVVRYMPSPIDVPPITGILDDKNEN